MYATVTNTKNKGSSLPMALRAVATERAVSSSSTALRRGELRSGPSIEVQAFKFSAKVSAGNKQPFSSNGQHLNQNHNKVVNHNTARRKVPVSSNVRRRENTQCASLSHVTASSH